MSAPLSFKIRAPSTASTSRIPPPPSRPTNKRKGGFQNESDSSEDERNSKQKDELVTGFDKAGLTRYSSEDDEEDNDEPITIADIEALSNLEEISYSVNTELEDLAFLLGTEIRDSLKVLSFPCSDFSDISQFFHLFPNLEELDVDRCTTSYIFSSLPPSLKKLKTIYAEKFLPQFQIQNIKNQPFYLSHLTLNYYQHSDFSILPFIPACIEELNLEIGNHTALAEALKLMNQGELEFKRMVVSFFSNRLIGKIVVEKDWYTIIQQCERLGMDLENRLD